MTVTIKDVCKATGDSLATVSRALNNRPRVKPATRQRILAAAAQLGYRPNAAARNLCMQKTDTIGAVFLDFASGFYANVMSGIEQESREQGLHLLLTVAHYTDPERDRHYDTIDASRVDGMIVLDGTLDEAGINQLKSFGHPFVLIAKDSDDPDVMSVTIDNVLGGRMACQHVLEQGCRDILLVTGPPEVEDSLQRLEGCRQALENYNLSLDDVTIRSGYSGAAGAISAFRACLSAKGLPRAIFAFNDEMALAIMKELRLAGYKVPDDVAVVGFDGLSAADVVGLTTVQVPMEELGREAVRLLAGRLKQQDDLSLKRVLETLLVVRESC